MSDVDARLTAALQADAPPARDPSFRVEVLVRLERARFRRRVARIVSLAAVAAVIAAMTAPALNSWDGGGCPAPVDSGGCLRRRPARPAWHPGGDAGGEQRGECVRPMVVPVISARESCSANRCRSIKLSQRAGPTFQL